MHLLTRRQLLQAAGAGAAALALPAGLIRAAEGDPFTLPKLPYAYDALEPKIDAETMKIHHDKHHAAYVTNLNAALKDHPEIARKGIVAILRDIKMVPETIRQAVINNGGGHANHTMFWEIMAAPGKGGGGKPTGELAKAIDEKFKNFEEFQKTLSDLAAKRFGSGWAWLVVDGHGKLDAISTANQDSPYMTGMKPLLGIDVWEHAYYLKYQNRRPEYIKAWWDVVNWSKVAERYNEAKKG
jgi:Fe-Mn family superoxide dismutase